MGSTRRSFTAEYKRSAVELVTASGRSVADVARSLGIGGTTLGNWVKKYADAPDPDKSLSESERAELERLRRENARLRMEAEFARKVAAWFAREEK